MGYDHVHAVVYRTYGVPVALTIEGTAPTARPGTAVSLDPFALLEQIRAAGATHVITVPDTHQKSLLALLSRSDEPQLITVCTEDEAMGVNLGLYLGGARPLLLIQNSGFYAAMNTIQGLSLDARVPACMLIGEFARDPAVAPADNAMRLVRLLEPTLTVWQIPYHRLDHPTNVATIPVAMEQAWADRGPVALLVGASTLELP
jgi:sulfopyruvate decarboxylase TPP-binding subunit